MWHEQFPLDRVSELSDLGDRNLGANAEIRTIRTKAAETRPLLPYTSWLIKQHPNRLPVADGLAFDGLGESPGNAPSLLTRRAEPHS